MIAPLPLPDRDAQTPEKKERLPMLTKFNQQFFIERLHHLMMQTGRYDETMPAAWEKICEENRHRTKQKDAVASDADIGPVPMHVGQLVQRIRNAGITNVVLEAAHAYAFQSMDDADFVRSMELQYIEAQKLTPLLEQHRIRVQRVLFIDNYNPHPGSGMHEKNLDVDAYVTMAQDHGFAPDYLIWEADMAPMARSMVEYMHHYQSLAAEKENGGDAIDSNGDTEKKLLLSYRGVELMSMGKGKMSCASLDAALSIIKYAHLGEGIVNILPKRQNEREFSFKGQQKKVRQILMDHLGVRVMPFFNIFTSDVESLPHSSGSHHAFRKKSH